MSTALIAALVLASQASPIVAIDLYGLRNVEASRVHAELGFTKGDAVDVDRDAVCARLEALSEIDEARIVEMNLNGSRIVLVGVKEAGTRGLALREPPTGELRLPEGMVTDYEALMDLFQEAIAKRVLGEDTSKGYSLSRYEPARAMQLAYRDRADDEFELLRLALRDSADEAHRAAAAYWIAYASDIEAVASELARAATDPSWEVRNNAVRAIGILFSYAASNQSLGLELDPAPLVQMLDSIEWTDLNKASTTLFKLTESRDPKLLAALREGALPGLADVARWTSRGHAWPAVAVLGRMAGIEEEAIVERYQSMTKSAEVAEFVLELVAKAKRRR